MENDKVSMTIIKGREAKECEKWRLSLIAGLSARGGLYSGKNARKKEVQQWKGVKIYNG